MKTKILFIIIVFTTFCNAQIINFPDANFKLALVNSTWQYGSIAKNISGSNMTVDTNSDGEIQISEAQQVYKLIINPVVLSPDINTLEGINNFTNLTDIIINGKSLSGLI